MQTSCTSATWTESIDLMATLTTENDEQVLVITRIGEAPRGTPVPTECTPVPHTPSRRSGVGLFRRQVIVIVVLPGPVDHQRATFGPVTDRRGAPTAP